MCTTVFDDGESIGDVPRQPMCSDVLDSIGFVWVVWSVYVENELEWRNDNQCSVVRVLLESNEPRSFASLNVELEGGKKVLFHQAEQHQGGVHGGDQSHNEWCRNCTAISRDGVISAHVIGSMC